MIATSTKVDLKGIDQQTVEKVSGEGYFTKDKKEQKKGEEAFFKQGEKPEVCGFFLCGLEVVALTRSVAEENSCKLARE